MASQTHSTFDQAEVDKFSSIADEWWDESGKFKPLHIINPLRISYINSHAGSLAEKKILDVGCGGGILSLPMARQGGIVTGIDASDENIKVALNYAKRRGVGIDYKATLIEKFSKNHADQFDIITALEVIEHVDNIEVFLKHIDKCLKPGGILFISTINRTFKSMALAKVAAEYILRWVPKGTHDWNKFVKPDEVIEGVGNAFDMIDISGMIFNPLVNSWKLSEDRTAINYIMALKKK